MKRARAANNSPELVVDVFRFRALLDGVLLVVSQGFCAELGSALLMIGVIHAGSLGQTLTQHIFERRVCDIDG